ncbi:hypothetical protein BO78DRAFT_434926 [Aspergillus sclerotiicarbonarius CBS 121057]|uniref:Uncharacterized protein n=1 Tax=Aspergillus sclerotiicarbonarius (strain CBS 121057 / IBT 28362) TaxID=1448318 RepID=A0A319ERZ3_ASPSB|nr:hypothetical protein BO78DRAFT_434926 [Aspergillus sclerotiicarbonarius CBS 121057]
MRSNQPSSHGLSLHTSFPSERACTADCCAMSITSTVSPVPPHPPAGPSSSSTTPTPLSSTTASPTSSPTLSPYPFRRFHHHRLSLTRDPINLNGNHHHYNNTSSPSSRSQSPFRLSYSSLLRRPSMLLRRRPSKVDLALCEERSRCDEDAIERQGLDLMEPRPVDPLGFSMDSMDASVFSSGSSMVGDRSSTQSLTVAQPRFVMGGIFEVLEGSG